MTHHNEHDITLRIPTALRAYTDRQTSVSLRGATAREVMDALVARYPGLRRHLLDADGALRSFVNLYINGQDIRALGGIEVPLSPGDKLSIIPAIAGGVRQ